MLGLSLAEVVVIGIVALLVFGHRLPEVAVQCAVQMQRLRRSLSDLRRESGVDRELRELRRTFEEASTPQAPHPRRLLREARGDVERILADPASDTPPAAAADKGPADKAKDAPSTQGSPNRGGVESAEPGGEQ
jgi:Sec-independent protein translocase protein TatA